MYLSTPGVPPTACRSSMTYLPEGLRLAMKGVSAAIRRKSPRVRSTPAARAIAMRWMVALVEPPVTWLGLGLRSGVGLIKTRVRGRGSGSR